MIKGIDLGTTNSSIAVLDGITPRVYDNNRGEKWTPSAVWIDPGGHLFVGKLARQHVEDDEGNCAVEFKLLMGSGMVYTFSSSGRSATPEELSAEVLKSLREDVERAGDDLTSAVIGVPAAFDQAACHATEVAAKIAGIGFTVLLQEPVAAAMAYGFQSTGSREQWLVYDFGGGTFDAAVIQLRDGMIKVLNHAGDDNLGGNDIDWAIVDKILVPALTSRYYLQDFRRGPQSRWASAFAKLKLHAEEAKILLSQSKVAPILINPLCQDGTGKWIRFEYSLERSELESLTGPFIRRTIEISKRVLQETRLYNPGAVQRIILVGGPTKMPLLRKMLQEETDIPLDYSVDPMTVVAQGAAIFAATVKAPDSRANPEPGQYAVDFEHEPVGIELEPQVPGVVRPPDGHRVDGLSIELIECKTGWRTGKIALSKNGAFVATLKAEKGRQNVFSVELLDAAGRLLDAAPQEIHYTVGNAPGDQTIIHSLSVGLANNETLVLLRKGEALPARKRAFLQTVSHVRKGQEGTLLRVPLVEGENNRADRNRLVGALELTGKEVSRDVPAGSDVEVTIEMDASIGIRAGADIPILDQHFPIDVKLQRPEPKPDELRTKLDREKSRLQQLELDAQKVQAQEAREFAEQLRPQMESLEESFQNVEADLHAAQKCQASLLEVQVRLDQLEQLLEWPKAVADSEEAIRGVQEVVDRWGEPTERKQLETVKEQIRAAIGAHDLDALKSRTGQIRFVARAVADRRPEWWTGILSHLLDEAPRMTDQELAGRLFERAALYAKAKDVEGLKACALQLLRLLPEDERTRAIMEEFRSTVMSAGVGRG
jgi:molecular chaperone DnaK